MKKLTALSLLTLIGTFLGASTANAANARFSVATGNWNATTTWAATSGGAAGASVPVAGDTVTIEGGHNVTVTVDAACATVTFTTATATSLSINSGITLSVSGAITIPRPGTNPNLIAVGAGTLNAGSVAFTSSGTAVRHEITISTGTVTVTGNVTEDTVGNASPSIIFTSTGVLNLGGALWAGGGGTLTTVAGSTVNYNGTAQTVAGFNYAGNLTLSGSGTVILQTGTTSVGGNLTLSGTPSATLVVNLSIGGDLNISGGTLDLATFTANRSAAGGTLTVASGATLRIGGTGTLPSNYNTHSIGGTSTIEYYGTAQAVAPLNSSQAYGNLTLSGSGTKTAASSFGVAGTMTVGSGVTFSPVAAVVINSGGAAGTLTGAGTIQVTRIVATPDLVSQYQFTTYTLTGLTVSYAGAGAQTVNRTATVGNYGALTTAGSGTKTLGGVVTVNGGLTIGASTTLDVSASNYSIFVGGNWANSGSFTTGTGTVTFNGAGAQSIGATTFYGVTVNNPGGTATLSGAITVNGDLTITAGALATGNNAVTFNGNFSNGGTFTAGSSAITIGGTGTQSIDGFTTTGLVSMTKASGTATFTDNVSGAGLTTSGAGTLDLGVGLTHTFTGTWTRTAGTLNGDSSTLNLGNATATSGTGTAFIAGTGTVNYNGAAQTGAAVVTYNNLTLSGSLAKTFATTPTVNGVLSMEGTATVTVTTGVVTYGPNATLQYNTASSRTVGAEWITPFAASGGVIIKSTGAITLNTAKVFNDSVPLTINSGATLISGSLQLTFGGDFVNGGTFTGGSSPIVITGAATSQSIGGFTTTGLVSMTKASGTATFTGNVNGGGLTLNGAGTLNLGTALTHTFTGTWTRTAGTLNGGTSTLSLGNATPVTGSGGTFTANAGTVNYSAAGAQTVATTLTYNNLTLSGSGAKTITGVPAIGGTLDFEGSATATFTGTATANSLTFVGVTQAAGTWGSTSSSATIQDNTHFASTGVLTVGTGVGPLSKFAISAISSPQTAGTPFTITTITAQDAGGHTVTSFGLLVTFGGTAGVTGTSAAFTSGVLSGASVTPTLAGSSLTVTVTSGSATGSATITTVNPGAVSQFVIAPATIASATAGTPFALTSITAKDANGNTCSSGPNQFTATVTYGGTAGVTGTSAAFTLGVLTSPSVTPTVAGSGETITVTFGSATGTATITTVNAGTATKLAITSVNGGLNPTAGNTFSVVVQSQDANGNAANVTAATAVSLTRNTGTGTVGGTTTGTIANGTSSITINGVTYSVAETGVSLTATRTSGNTLTAGNSSPFTTVSPTLGDYRSQVTGTWGTAGTWQTYNGSTWATAASAPTSATTGQITVQNSHTVTVAVSVTAQNLVISGGGTVSINSGITLTVNNGVANGVISGSGILAESGANNRLTLNGANTYSGGTVISAGTVAITDVAANLGTAGITFNSGGTLLNTGSGAQTTAKAITLTAAGGGGVITMAGPTMQLTGTIGGGGGLTSGGSDLILAPGANNTIGTMTVNSGRLFVGNAAAIANSAVLHINNGATLDFQYAAGTPGNTMVFASGSCLANRSGSTITANPANITFPTSGTMIFNQDDLASSAITVSGAYPALTGPLTIQVGGSNPSVGTVTLSGAISGSGGLTKTSNGTLILGAASSYTGGTTVSAGSLTANVTGSLNGGSLSVASGATVTLTSGTTDTVADLYLGGVPQLSGTWGGTGSTATYIDTTYFAAATGVLTVQAVPTSTGLTSSSNPQLPATGVTFTATVTPVVGSGTPAGTVQFKANGVAFGSTVTLSGGSATSAAISTLPHGNNAITAEYSGGTGFLTSTGSVTQVINTPPAVGTQNLTTTENTALNVSATTLASLNFDADGDTLTITAVNSPSTQGGIVSLSAGTITYNPPSPTFVGADSFTYTISDGFPGGTAICTANVTVQLSTGATSQFTYVSASSGTVNLRGYGIPNKSYSLQRSGTADFSSGYTVLGTVTAGPSGVILYTDTGAPSPSFYRFAVQ